MDISQSTIIAAIINLNHKLKHNIMNNCKCTECGYLGKPYNDGHGYVTCNVCDSPNIIEIKEVNIELAVVTIVNPVTGFYTCVKVKAIDADGVINKHNKAGKLTSVIKYVSNTCISEK